MSIKITNDNYDTYKRVFIIVSEELFKNYKFLPEDVNPISVMENIEFKGRSYAKRSLQAGLNDFLSQLKYSPKEMLNEIEAQLKKENLPDLSILLAVVQKSIRKVLRAKKIKDIDQYYMIKEVLDDTTSNISEEERWALSKYLADFELKYTSNQK